MAADFLPLRLLEQNNVSIFNVRIYFMKALIAALVFASFTFSTQATAKEPRPQLDEFKQKLVLYVDSEISILTQFKTCIQAAEKQTDFELCKNAKNDAQQKKMVEMQKDRLETQKKQLAIQEKNLNDAVKREKK